MKRIIELRTRGGAVYRFEVDDESEVSRHTAGRVIARFFEPSSRRLADYWQLPPTAGRKFGAIYELAAQLYRDSQNGVDHE